MAEEDLRDMVMNFRVCDLQVLLSYAGRNKSGKKQELQKRALELLMYPKVVTKIKELHYGRYNQLNEKPTNYDIPERNLTDCPMPNYEPAMDLDNNCGVTLGSNLTVRPMSMNHRPAPRYSGKPYYPPMPSQQHLTQYADVKFKELPFYDELHCLLRPFILIPGPIDRLWQEADYTFSLSRLEAHDIAVSKDSTGNYGCHILLRFCILESGTEQDDNFPPNLRIKINGKPLLLPNLLSSNPPGVEPKHPSKPINITPFTKLSRGVNNTITLSWSSSCGRPFAAVLYIARLLSSFTLLQRLKNRKPSNADYTKAMIIEKLQQGQDLDIATTSLQASLICPLGKVKIELPCRAVTCAHIACFDALTYIQLNEKKPKWKCPICDKPALYENLILDGLFMDIVSKVPVECTDVKLHDDGSWTPIMPEKQPKEVAKVVIEPSKKNSESGEVVDISSDSDTDDIVETFRTTTYFI